MRWVGWRGAFAAGSVAAVLMISAQGAAAQVTATAAFSSPGGYSFTVPAGVSTLGVTAVGGAGGQGGCNGGGGGKGAMVSASVSVSSGEVLSVVVGGTGANGSCAGGNSPGGVGGGGNAPNGGGGGGGASVLGAGLGSGFDSVFLVAAGGGGGGVGNGSGGAGGAAGAAGAQGAGDGGGGAAGTATGGGAGGAAGGLCGGGNTGGSGSFGQGGVGAVTISGDGGGGGGGYYGGGGGGGGGCFGGGGGGGSSFAAPQSTVTSAPAPTSSPAEVVITYAAPTADLNASALTFSPEPQGVASAEQDLAVANGGSAPLIVSGILITGQNPGDYLIDNGCQRPVAPGATCNVGVRFDPQSPGASAATLTLLTNAAAEPGAVSLSGTGGALPQGPTGPQGPAGARGPAGQVELITCRTITKKIKGHKRKVKKCTGRSVSGTVKFTTTGELVHATLSRRGVVYATGASVQTAGGSQLLVLNDSRHLVRGDYTLTLHFQRGHRQTTSRVRLTMA